MTGRHLIDRTFPPTQRFAALLHGLTARHGHRMELARLLNRKPSFVYDICSGRYGRSPRPGLITEIANALRVDAPMRRALHLAAALDAGYELGDLPVEVHPSYRMGI